MPLQSCPIVNEEGSRCPLQVHAQVYDAEQRALSEDELGVSSLCPCRVAIWRGHEASCCGSLAICGDTGVQAGMISRKSVQIQHGVSRVGRGSVRHKCSDECDAAKGQC